MGDVSKTTIIGNVGQDPQIVTFQDGGKVASLSVATNERWKDSKSGESKVRTEWHRVVVRDQHLIERTIEPYVKKGSKIYVEGKNETRDYDKDGVKHYTTEVVVRSFGGDIQLLDGVPKDSPQGNGSRTTSSNNGPAPRR